jgi:acetyl esterase/lipase
MSAKRRAGIYKVCTAYLFLWAAWVPLAQGASKDWQLTAIPTPRDVYAIPLRKTPGAGLSGAQEQWAQAGDLRIVRNVSEPTLTPVLPDAGKGSGAAVIIAPGGAFLMLSIDGEGYKVARWLADHGVAGLVLKYRTEATPTEDAAFQAGMRQRLAQFATNSAHPYPGEALALEDALDALRVARARASEMGVDPARIGFLGFSAGAVLALQAAVAQEESLRPLFAASIYGPLQARTVVKGPAPLFVAHAQDDKILHMGDLGLIKSWRSAGGSIELHLFERGGHGFAVTQQGASSDHWLEEFYWWMSARGALKPAAAVKPVTPP